MMTDFPVDPGNPFLNQSYPANMSCGQIQTSDGPRLLVTFRSGPATLSFVLDKTDAAQWGKSITDAGAALSSLIVAPIVPPNIGNLANGQMN